MESKTIGFWTGFEDATVAGLNIGGIIVSPDPEKMSKEDRFFHPRKNRNGTVNLPKPIPLGGNGNNQLTVRILDEDGNTIKPDGFSFKIKSKGNYPYTVAKNEIGWTISLNSTPGGRNCFLVWFLSIIDFFFRKESSGNSNNDNAEEVSNAKSDPENTNVTIGDEGDGG